MREQEAGINMYRQQRRSSTGVERITDYERAVIRDIRTAKGHIPRTPGHLHRRPML